MFFRKLFCGLLLFNISLFSQWAIQPNPYSADCRTLHFFDDQKGFVTSLDGHLLKTTDGGYTWLSAYHFSEELHSLDFINQDIGWAGCSNGKIFKTQNGGASWDEYSISSIEEVRSISFINNDYGFCVSKNLAFKTTDGGVSWIQLNTGTTMNLFKIKFFNTNQGICTAFGGKIIKTSDGGTTWNAVQVGPSLSLINGLFGTDPNNIWTADNKGEIYFSSDFGDTWTTKYTSSSILNEIYFSGSYGCAAGSSGYILLSSDGGNNWTVQNSKTTKNLKSVQFVNGNMGWSVGDDGVIIHYDANEPQLYIIYPQNDRFFIADSTIQLIWSSSLINNINIEYSTNNGTDWEEIITNLPAEQSPYAWQPPYLHTGCKIKMYDVNNPGVQDEVNFSISLNSSHDYIVANSILMWTGNDGQSAHNPNNDRSGLYWPGGIYADKTAVFADGLLWGGIVSGDKYVNGSTYRKGMQPGMIISPGTADNPDNLNKYGVWKIYKDWENLSAGKPRTRYMNNEINWPVDMGAPWNDVNGDSVYSIGIDEPWYIGDEVIWTIYNDLDPAKAAYLYGSPSLGIEIQSTTFASSEFYLDNVMFKKYLIKNKSQSTINDMYLSYWIDPDIGDGYDDYVGCDTSRNLGYSYNGDNYDPIYGTPPPIIGFQLLQGPIVPGNTSDSAFSNFRWIKGFKNLPMTSFAFYINSYAPYFDPSLGTYEGTIEMYNYMQGFLWDGTPYINPLNNEPTKFPLSGDPIAQTGWYEGPGWPGGPDPYDRRCLISSGPFTMEPGQSQEIVITLLLKTGEDNLSGLTYIKNQSNAVKNYYYAIQPVSDINEKNLPDIFSLSQNYPNPFNPNTKISYSIPRRSIVQISIYNLLGEKIRDLVNEEKSAGEYSVVFNSQSLASGVYFYRMQAGNYTDTKKMVVLK